MFWFSLFALMVTPLTKLNQAVVIPRRATYPPQTRMQQSSHGACCNLKLQCCRLWASSCGVLPKPLTLNKQTLVDLCLVNHSYLASQLPPTIFRLPRAVVMTWKMSWDNQSLQPFIGPWRLTAVTEDIDFHQLCPSEDGQQSWEQSCAVGSLVVDIK